MYPASFEYRAAHNIEEAIELLSSCGEDGQVLAGGQSLIPLMKLRLARPKVLVDLNRVSTLNYVKEDQGRLLLGAMTRHFEAEKSSIINAKIPLIAEAAAHIGDVQVRNRGTVGGALAEADPAGDWGTVALALNARIKCVGPQGERYVDAKDFFTFAYTTALETNEILCEAIFPIPNECSSGSYLKLERVAGDFAIVSIALQMQVNDHQVCESIGIGLGGVGVVPIKPFSVENLLLGKVLSSDLIEEAEQLICENIDPPSDSRGSAEYKREVLKVLFRRALMKAIRGTDSSEMAYRF